jgi:hypothetical protein
VPKRTKETASSIEGITPRAKRLTEELEIPTKQ